MTPPPFNLMSTNWEVLRTCDRDKPSARSPESVIAIELSADNA